VVSYITRRLLLAIPTLVLVSLGVFSLLRLIPGDTVMALIADAGMVPKENLDAVRHQLGLDAPFAVQYVHWIGGILTGDFGSSLITKKPVLGELAHALPVTLELALLSLGVSLSVALPLGVISAMNHNSPIDHVARFLSVIGIAVPDFWLGTLVILGLSLWLHYLPPTGFVSLFADPARNLEQVWIPVVIIGVRLSAITTRMTRSMMLDVLHQDFIRTAIAKGVTYRRMLIRHALKNALIPVVTVVGNQFAALMAGALVMETLFSLPGVGQLTFTSIQRRDYAQIQGNVMALASLVVLINLSVDVLYAWLDPRIRYT